MYIKLYLTRQEKTQLDVLAKQKQMSVSKLCHDRIFPLQDLEGVDLPQIKESILSIQEEVPPSLTDETQKSYSSRTCSHSVKVYFTESEFTSLQSDAKGLPLSRFIRKEFLSRKEPVKILVDTDDISFLTMKVSAYTERLNNLIASLALQQQLCESDYEQLLQIASETEKALRDAANYAKANRTSIRASGVRILRKEIRRVLEKLQREEQTK